MIIKRVESKFSGICYNVVRKEDKDVVECDDWLALESEDVKDDLGDYDFNNYKED